MLCKMWERAVFLLAIATVYVVSALLWLQDCLGETILYQITFFVYY